MHERSIVVEAINEVYKEFLSIKGFEKIKPEEMELTDSYYGFQKNKLIVIFYLNPRMPYELSFLKKGETYNRRKAMINMMNPILPVFSKEKDEYQAAVWEKTKEFKTNSTDFYKYLILSDLAFVEKHYSSMFEEGVLAE